MGKEILNQVQEVQRVPYRINPRRNMPRHILIKLSKIKYKEKMLKAAREKQQITYKGNPIGLTADLSAETLQARREWQDIFKVMKGKNLQPRLLYPGGINQDGGVEGRALTPSCESTRITSGCWTIIDRKTLELTKEDTPRPRTEEKPQ